MRLIVDEMPKETIDCPFGRVFTYLYSDQIKQTKCSRADGGPCELKNGVCPWLIKLNNNDENFEELYHSLLVDTYHTDTMKELLEWLSPNLEAGYNNEKK